MQSPNSINATCQQAIDEIELQIKNQPLQSNIYNQWMKKWSNLYRHFDLPALFGPAEKFYEYFYRFEEYSGYLSYKEDTALASEHYLKLDPNDENALLIWLVNNESLGINLSLFIYDQSENNLSEKSLYIDIRYCKIDASEFKEIIVFCDHFHTLYFQKLSKYSTFTEDEKRRVGDDEELGEKMLSLSYHLKKRGIIN